MIKATILIFAIPLYIISRILSVRITKKNTNWLTEIIFLLFFVYILILVGVSVFPIMIDKMYVPFGLSRINMNLIPFSELVDKIIQHNGNIFGQLIIVLKCIGGNVILLIPFGLFYPILFNDKRETYYKYYVGFLLVVTIKFAQLVQTAYGYNFSLEVNMTDIIFNVIGFAVGYTISHKLIGKGKIYRIISKYDLTIREVESNNESA